ncbi:MAG TPA: hypothetical protein VFZ65_07980 [Planctomycetota bacterium]|nr:hypothetical protein [Planctomycetota bacterium]
MLRAFIASIPAWLLPAMLPAQVHVREWGQRCVDTRLAELDDYMLVGTGTAHTLAVRANGEMVAWGWNLEGQCLLPELPLGARAVQVAGGGPFTLVLTDQGEVLACGSNAQSECTVPPLPAGRRYTKVAACNSHGAALRDDGAVLVWGDNSGAGQMWPAMYTVPALPPGLVYTDVAIGGYDVVALRSDGAIITWGMTTPGVFSAPAIPPGRTVVAIDADSIQNGSHALALLDDGTILAWGDNTFGQCNVPALAPLTTYSRIAAGALHCAALRSDGSVVCWGGSAPEVRRVPPLPRGVTYRALAAGSDFTIALRTDGRVVVWGRLGYHLIENAPAPPAGASYAAIAENYFHVVAALSDGTLRAWGLNALDECHVPGGHHYVDVGAGYHIGAALTADGAIQVWGDASTGTLAVPQLPPGVVYSALSVGWNHVAAIRSDGSAVVWGAANTAVLQLPPGMSYVQVAAGPMWTTLLRSDGMLVQNSAVLSWPGTVVTRVHQGTVLMARLRDGSIEPSTIANCGTCNLPPLPFGVYYVEADSGGNGKALVARRSDGSLVVWGQPWHQQEHVPALAPGQSWLEIDVGLDTVVARYGPESTYVSFAAGCAGSQPASRLIPHDTPRIGTTLRVEIDHLPQNLAVLVGSWNRIPGGMSLAPYGLPGCTTHVPVDSTAVLVGSGGWARHELSIPPLLALVGAVLYEQAVVLDSAGNSLGVVVSDAARMVIGP